MGIKRKHQLCSLRVSVKSSSMNVHLLYHLHTCVKLWGPLWAYSCFHFKNQNGYLKSLFHVTRDMSKRVHLSCIFLPVVSFSPAIQMAFSYIVMQALSPTLNTCFSNLLRPLSTFANIVYRKKCWYPCPCVTILTCMQSYITSHHHWSQCPWWDIPQDPNA